MSKKSNGKKEPQTEANGKMTDSEMLTLANKIVQETLRMERAKKRRDKLTAQLQPAMIAAKLKRIPVPDLDRTVDLKHDTSRNVSKKDVVKSFGKKGEEFWNTLPKKDRFYLSVAHHKEDEDK